MQKIWWGEELFMKCIGVSCKMEDLWLLGARPKEGSKLKRSF
jgi:hypothetical protein